MLCAAAAVCVIVAAHTCMNVVAAPVWRRDRSEILRHGDPDAVLAQPQHRFWGASAMASARAAAPVAMRARPYQSPSANHTAARMRKALLLLFFLPCARALAAASTARCNVHTAESTHVFE